MSNIIIRTMTITEAAKAMRDAGIRISEDRLRAGMEQGGYSWGDCVKMRCPEYTVYQKLFYQWMKERGEPIENEEGETS